MVEISVIMYVKNDHLFLKESLNSLINQTFNNLEVICVNDGSTDNSLDILEEYQQKYDMITIKTGENAGLSNAVNSALEEITGKYVYITNPGCILEKKALEVLYEKSEENNNGLTVANMKIIDESKNTWIIKSFNKAPGPVFNYKSLDDLMNMDSSTQNKLILSSLIRENNIKFQDNELFTYNLIFKAENISYIQETLFTQKEYYNKFKNRNDEELYDRISSTNNLIEIFRKNDEWTNYKWKLYDHKMHLTLDGLNKIKIGLKEEYFQRLRKDYKQMLLDDDIEDFLDNVSGHFRKFFEMIIISESYYEYELLKKTYYKMNDYYQLLIDRNYFKNAQEEMNKLEE